MVISKNKKYFNGCKLNRWILLISLSLFQFNLLAQEPIYIRPQKNTKCITDIHYSLDDKFLIVCSIDSSSSVWNVNSSKKLFELKGHHSPIIRGVFSNNGDIITCDFSGVIKKWNLSGKISDTKRGHDSTIYIAKYSKNYRYLITVGDDRKLKVWDGKLTIKFSINLDEYDINDLNTTSDENWLIIQDDNNRINIYSLSDGKHLFKIPDENESLDTMKIPAISLKSLVTGNYGNEDEEDEDHFDDEFRCSTFSKFNGELITQSRNDKELVFWSIPLSPRNKRVKIPAYADKILTSNNGKFIVVYNGVPTKSELSIMDLKNGNELLKLEGNPYGIKHLKISPNDKYLIGIDANYKCKLWDLSSGEIIRDFNNIKLINCLDFSNSGQFIVFGNVAGEIYQYKINGGILTQLKNENE